MNFTGKLIALFCLMLTVHGWAADFDSLPSATESGDSVKIEFTVSENCVVTVEILDENDNVACHLGSGLIGEKALWNWRCRFTVGFHSTIFEDVPHEPFLSFLFLLY